MQLAVVLVHDPVGAAHPPVVPPAPTMMMVLDDGAGGGADALGRAGGEDAALTAGAALHVTAEGEGIQHLKNECSFQLGPLIKTKW